MKRITTIQEHMSLEDIRTLTESMGYKLWQHWDGEKSIYELYQGHSTVSFLCGITNVQDIAIYLKQEIRAQAREVAKAFLRPYIFSQRHTLSLTELQQLFTESNITYHASIGTSYFAGGDRYEGAIASDVRTLLCNQVGVYHIKTPQCAEVFELADLYNEVLAHPAKRPFRIWITLVYRHERGSVTISEEWYLRDEQAVLADDYDALYCELKQQEW